MRQVTYHVTGFVPGHLSMLEKLRQRLSKSQRSVVEVTPITPTPRSAYGARDNSAGKKPSLLYYNSPGESPDHCLLDTRSSFYLLLHVTWSDVCTYVYAYVCACETRISHHVLDCSVCDFSVFSNRELALVGVLRKTCNTIITLHTFQTKDSLHPQQTVI